MAKKTDAYPMVLAILLYRSAVKHEEQAALSHQR